MYQVITKIEHGKQDLGTEASLNITVDIHVHVYQRHPWFNQIKRRVADAAHAKTWNITLYIFTFIYTSTEMPTPLCANL